MMKIVKIVLKVVLVLLVLLVLVVAGYLIYVITDYNRIPDNQEIAINDAIDSDAQELIETEYSNVKVNTQYSITSYNIGFGAYCQDYSFFMDGGTYSRGISEEDVRENVNGAIETIEEIAPDFAFFQEVDEDSTRSYHINQREMVAEAFDDYNNAYAVNYHSSYLFYPITCPHGQSNSGIFTLSKYKLESSIRRSFPISTAFPDKFFDLDRCYSVTKVATEDGKYLCLYNVHLSAYTDDGNIRTSQIEMLTEDMLNEYEQGNYIVCGGDFNHDMLGNSDEVFGNEEGDYNWASPFPFEMLPEGFTVATQTLTEDEIANIVPSCRNTDKAYEPGVNEVWLLDTFIVSDNVVIEDYETEDVQFMYSDHNPVRMIFSLKGENDSTDKSDKDSKSKENKNNDSEN